MTKRHFCPVKVEEVHQFDRLSLSKSRKVDPFGFVVELDLHGKDLDVFWTLAYVLIQGQILTEEELFSLCRGSGVSGRWLLWRCRAGRDFEAEEAFQKV